MKDNTIKFNSLTQALKVKNLLKFSKIKCELERISGKNSAKGCAYQLKFNADINYIKNILTKNNMKIY